MPRVNKKKPGACICSLLASLSLSGCITLSSQAIDISELNGHGPAPGSSLQAQVDYLARPLIDEGATPGLMVAVYTPATGNRFFGYGHYDKQVDTPPDADTAFAVGSLTKLFTGALTTYYVQQGLLSWDDALAELLPEGTRLSEDAAAITLRQLVTHTSGLPRQPMTVQTFSYFVRYLFTGRSFYDHFDQDYMLRFLAEFEKPTFDGYVYSNFGYALLGRILELHTGYNIEGLLDQHILGPLQMRETALSLHTLPDDLAVARGHAGDQPGFIRRGDPVPDWSFTPLMRTTGALYSTASDLLRFARAHFENTQDQPGRAMAESLEVQYRDDSIAVGVDWEEDRIGEQRIHFAVGFVGGYSSYIGIDDENQLAVIVLQNSFNWEDKVGHRLMLRLGPNGNGQKLAASEAETAIR